MRDVVGGVYQVQERLGEGGMGVVYRGVHRLTEQEVAIKALPPEMSADPALRERFLREAKVLERLEHPNIVSLVNFLEEDERFYLVMQYVRGAALADVFDEGERMPAANVVALAKDVLSALAHAHEQGVVHRDIKPDNILLRKDGRFLVTDFGVAQMAGTTRMTSTGVAVGTVWYMSPEQVMGLPIDHRSDLYSLGVMLYELISGDLPFPSDSDYEVRKGHVEAPPPRLSRSCPEVPSWLRQVVHRSLAKSPDDRFPSSQAFLNALDEGPRRPANESSQPRPAAAARPAPASTTSPSEALARRASKAPGSPSQPATGPGASLRGKSVKAMLFCGRCGNQFVPKNPLAVGGLETMCPVCWIKDPEPFEPADPFTWGMSLLFLAIVLGTTGLIFGEVAVLLVAALAAGGAYWVKR